MYLTKMAYVFYSAQIFFFTEEAAELVEKETRENRQAEEVYPITVYGEKNTGGFVTWSEIKGDIQNGFIEGDNGHALHLGEDEHYENWLEEEHCKELEELNEDDALETDLDLLDDEFWLGEYFGDENY